MKGKKENEEKENDQVGYPHQSSAKKNEKKSLKEKFDK